MTSVFGVENFTGGLNLRADVFNIGKAESPDMLNVDIDPRGGVQQRAGLASMNNVAVNSYTAGEWEPKRLFHWRKTNGQLLLATNNKVFYAEEDNFTDTGIVSVQEYGAEFAEWIGDQPYLYVSCGHNQAGAKWDGSSYSSLTASGSGAWQNDLLSPSGTHIPTAEHIAVHVDRLWVANVEENGVGYPDRVRFSHPLFPESWRENDYIDVVGGGSGIRAIVPFSSHLLVFKERAVYAIYGYNQETFQVVPLTQELGTYSSLNVASSEQAVYFFSFPDGVFKYDGTRFIDIFESLRPLIESGEINRNSLDTVHLNWITRKVFVALPVGIDPSNFENYDDTDASGTVFDDYEVKYDGYLRPPKATATFVYDPSVGDKGAWTRYQTADGYGVVCGVDYVTPSGVSGGVVCHPHYAFVLRFDPTLHQDSINNVNTNFSSFYTMAWQDLGQPQAKKFWRAPEFVVSRVADAYTLNVDVFHDWNTYNYDRTFDIDFVADNSGTPDNLEQWIEYYGADTVRGETLGSARSVQVRFGCTGSKWGVNAVLFRYSFRKVRV